MCEADLSPGLTDSGSVSDGYRDSSTKGIALVR